jgi:hypothetical protein
LVAALMRSSRPPDGDIAIFVPPEVVFPDMKADERTLVQLLSGLNRNETIIACCRANEAHA